MAQQQQSQGGGFQSQQSQSMGRRGCLATGIGGALIIALLTSLATGIGTGVGRTIADRVITWVECLFNECDAEAEPPEAHRWLPRG